LVVVQTWPSAVAAYTVLLLEGAIASAVMYWPLMSAAGDSSMLMGDHVGLAAVASCISNTCVSPIRSLLPSCGSMANDFCTVGASTQSFA
jgi:hypothetical protein